MFDLSMRGCLRSSSKALTVFIGLLLLVSAGGCKKSPAPETAPSSGSAPSAGKDSSSGKIYQPDIAQCAGFTVEDAGEILGVPAEKIKMKAEVLKSGTGMCSYAGGSLEKTVVFNLSAAKTVKEAADEMASHRSNLEVAAGTAPFKDKLPNGAYSDIMGLGDDGIWTDVNKTLSIRRGNVFIMVTSPNDKTMQLKTAQKVLSKL